MLQPGCPACESKHVQWRVAASRDLDFNCYRCNDRGHVWNVPKGKPDDPPRHLTPLPGKPLRHW
jgi:hypothetical protein